MRQTLYLLIVTLGLVSFGLLPGCSRRGEPDRPGARAKNVILISMDTVRADHLSSYGYHRRTTPRLDVYAKTGCVFDSCTSPSSWTVPSHLTLFTSMEPATYRCVYYPMPKRLNENYQTMAKIFSQRGFRTAAFTGGGYAGPRHGMDIGFDLFVNNGRHFEHNMEAVWEWFDSEDTKPFFLFLHGFNAHRNYVPPSPYKERFARSYAGDYDVTTFAPGKPRPSPTDLEYVISQYDGDIAHIDDLLGDFLDELDRRGILKDTLVILVSDHGDAFYEHGQCDHIHTLYDELTHVPWMMFGPRVPVTRVSQLVGLIDLLPTTLALLDISVDAPFQGVNRIGLLHDSSTADDAVVYSFTGKGTAPHHLSSVRTNRWKLITDLPAGCINIDCAKCERGEEEGKSIELVDLRNDPGETRNVANQHPEVVERLYALLRTRLAQCETLRLQAEQPAPPTPEYLETLKTLGYVGEEGD